MIDPLDTKIWSRWEKGGVRAVGVRLFVCRVVGSFAGGKQGVGLCRYLLAGNSFVWKAGPAVRSFNCLRWVLC